MELKFFKRSDFGGRVKSTIPKLTVRKSGLVSLNAAAMSLTGLSYGDAVLFAVDRDAADVYMQKAPADVPREEAFVIRSHKEGGAFGAKALVHMIKEALDLALGDGKKPSIRLDIEKVDLEMHGEVFKIY